jgi:hypothetical protein
MQSSSSTAAISHAMQPPEEVAELKLSIAEKDKMYRAISQSYHYASNAGSSTSPLSDDERLLFGAKAVHLRKLAMLNWSKIRHPDATDIKNFIYYRSETALQYNEMAYIYAIPAQVYIKSKNYIYSLDCYRIAIQVLTEALNIAGNTCLDPLYKGLFTAHSPLPDINLIETIAASIDDIHKNIAQCHQTEKRWFNKSNSFPHFQYPLPEKNESGEQFQARLALTPMPFNIKFFYVRGTGNRDPNAGIIEGAVVRTRIPRRSPTETFIAQVEEELFGAEDKGEETLLPIRRR